MIPILLFIGNHWVIALVIYVLGTIPSTAITASRFAKKLNSENSGIREDAHISVVITTLLWPITILVLISSLVLILPFRAIGWVYSLAFSVGKHGFSPYLRRIHG